MPVLETESVSTLKQKVGVDLNEIFEGYSFKRKEGGCFIFGNDDHEVSFTLDAVKRSLKNKVDEERVETLQRQLKDLGISRQRFALPRLTLSVDAPAEYEIVKAEGDLDYLWLRSECGDERRVHVSTLRELQTHIVLTELKRLEADFESLPLDFILLRVDEMHQELERQAKLTYVDLGDSLTSARIRGLLAKRIAEYPDELDELNENNLRRLSDELKRGIDSVAVVQTRVMSTLITQRDRVERRRATLRTLARYE